MLSQFSMVVLFASVLFSKLSVARNSIVETISVITVVGINFLFITKLIKNFKNFILSSNDVEA